MLGKFALDIFSPLQLIFVRLLIATLVFTLILLRQKNFFKTLSAIFSRLPYFLILGVCGIGLAMITGFFGLKLTTAIHYDLLFNIGAIFIAIFSYIHFRERIHPRAIIFFLTALGGTWLIVTQARFSFEIFQGGTIKGDLLVIGAALGWALYSVLGKIISKQDPKVTSIAIVYGSFLVSGIMMVPYILFQEPIFFSGLDIKGGEVLGALGATVALAVFATAILFWAWFHFLQKSTGILASMVVLSENVGGVIFPIIFLGEHLTIWTAFGGLMIIVPLFIEEYTQSFRRSSRRSLP